MAWDETCLYFVNKDLEATDNLAGLSKAGVANSAAPNKQQD